RNSAEMVKAGDAYAVKIFEEYNGSPMTAFPQLSDQDLDNILAYTAEAKPEPAVSDVAGGGAQTSASGDSTNMLVLGALILVLLVFITMRYIVKKGFKDIAIAKGVEVAETTENLWQAFDVSQLLVFVLVVFLLIVDAYLGSGDLLLR